MKTQDFCGFKFGNIHSSDLNLTVVSTSNRYEKDLLPSCENYESSIPGSDGSYYFGSTFSTKVFEVEIAFDNVSESNWRKISQLFATDQLKDLVFDELPYKVYKAKMNSKPEFKYICFINRETGERVYKGDGRLTFICYFPYAFCPNKYLVRTADYYIYNTPETIIKEHFNKSGNMDKIWSGGYPTLEQVQNGELFFDNENEQKTLIDTRNYWKNLPEWSASSGLLTTPTLDNEQNLIYAPQYSKINYFNMDIGLNKENSLMGTRLLVYNPGDTPIDFKLNLKLNNRLNFLTGGERGNKFQIRRLNVDRIEIPSAVDWTGLTTESSADNETYKYGNKYFKIVEKSNFDQIEEEDVDTLEIESYYHTLDLFSKHPKYTYLTQPIPREKLGHFIKLWFWQSNQMGANLDIKKGNDMADRYEELLELCITEEEKQQLYWETLKDLLKNYSTQEYFTDEQEIDNPYTIDSFIYDYIYKPQEYIIKKEDSNYGEEEFNYFNYPSYYTEDYIEIELKNLALNNETLFLDSSKQMIYTESYSDSKYNYKATKNILNDNIAGGHWFKIPTGWSVIEIIPVVSNDLNEMKRWIDARPFNWGYGPKEDGNKWEIQRIFDKVYKAAADKYVGFNSVNGIIKGDSGYAFPCDIEEPTTEELQNLQDSNIKFRLWYGNPETDFGKQIVNRKRITAEIDFLKTVQKYWSIVGQFCHNFKYPFYDEINKETVLKMVKGEIKEWWWYSSNYIWANYPPVYWCYADLVEDISIDYTPLFY